MYITSVKAAVSHHYCLPGECGVVRRGVRRGVRSGEEGSEEGSEEW